MPQGTWKSNSSCFLCLVHCSDYTAMDHTKVHGSVKRDFRSVCEFNHPEVCVVFVGFSRYSFTQVGWLSYLINGSGPLYLMNAEVCAAANYFNGNRWTVLDLTRWPDGPLG